MHFYIYKVYRVDIDIIIEGAVFRTKVNNNVLQCKIIIAVNRTANIFI